MAHIELKKKKRKKGEDAEVLCGGSVRRADGTGECSRCLLGSLSGLTGPPPEAAPRTFLHLPRTLRVSPAGGSRAARCRITPHCLHASFFFFLHLNRDLSDSVLLHPPLHHGVGPHGWREVSRRGRPVPGVRLPAVRAAPPAGGSGVLLPSERRVQREEGLHR